MQLSKMLKLVCALVIGDAPIHDVAAREKHLIGSEHAFCALLPNFRSRSKIFHQTTASSVQPF